MKHCLLMLFGKWRHCHRREQTGIIRKSDPREPYPLPPQTIRDWRRSICRVAGAVHRPLHLTWPPPQPPATYDKHTNSSASKALGRRETDYSTWRVLEGCRLRPISVPFQIHTKYALAIHLPELTPASPPNGRNFHRPADIWCSSRRN